MDPIRTDVNSLFALCVFMDLVSPRLLPAAHGDSRSPYLMQQAALGSLSNQYFVVLRAMLSAYARGRIGEPALRSFDAVTETESLTSRNIVVVLATLCQDAARARMDSRFIGSYLTHERPTRPISKAIALGRETGSTSCSRRPDRQLARRL